MNNVEWRMHEKTVSVQIWSGTRGETAGETDIIKLEMYQGTVYESLFMHRDW